MWREALLVQVQPRLFSSLFSTNMHKLHSCPALKKVFADAQKKRLRTIERAQRMPCL